MSHNTPAVSITEYQTGTYDRKQYLNGTLVSSFVKPKQILRRTDFRPASVHTPRNAGGTYHENAPWQHLGGYTRTDSYVIKQVGSLTDVRSMEAGFWYPNPVTSIGDIDPAVNGAIKKALAGLGDTVRQMNVFFREANEVLHLTEQFGNGVQRGLHNLIDLTANSWEARRDMRRFLRHGWKEVPSFYLAYIFGVAPLAGDLENAVSALSDLTQAGGNFSLVVKGRNTVKSTYNAGMQAEVGDIQYFARIQRAVKGRCTLRFELPASKLGAFEFITPFSTAYETTRMSFVLDYILPVGQWLAGLESCQLAPFFRDGSTSFKVTDAVNGPGFVLPAQAFARVTASGEYIEYQRKVLSGFPYSAAFRPPSFKLPGLQAIGVLGALIGQRLNTLSRVVRQL